MRRPTRHGKKFSAVCNIKEAARLSDIRIVLDYRRNLALRTVRVSRRTYPVPVKPFSRTCARPRFDRRQNFEKPDSDIENN